MFRRVSFDPLAGENTMKRAAALVVAVTIILVAVHQTRATSNPIIDVDIFGIELCPQSVCGAADFAGVFEGRIGNTNFATGVFDVSVNHDPLPAPGKSAAITGGTWSLSGRKGLFDGVVTRGTLFNNGNNTFAVYAVLELQQGGTGDLIFLGTLNHNTAIPTISGTLSQ
jgi:hypothetical protein